MTPRAALIFAICAIGSVIPASAATYVSFGVPGAEKTTPWEINRVGTIAGWYLDSGGVQHGFQRTADGTITTFDPSGAEFTQPLGINSNGVIVGNITVNNVPLGFVRGTDGTTTEFSAPDSDFTFATGINGSGVIVGYFNDANNIDDFHGFTRTRGGKIRIFDAGAGQTSANAINDAGETAGTFLDGQVHGFVRASDGTVTIFDPTGSTLTAVYNLNNSGTVAGDYIDSSGQSHGFMRGADGTITAFDPPLSIGTFVGGLSEKGVISGTYKISKRRYKAFIRKPTGKIEIYTYPGDTNSTAGEGINSSDTAVGYYVDETKTQYGYVRTK